MTKNSLFNSLLLTTTLGVMAWVGHKAADNAEQLAGLRASVEALKDSTSKYSEGILRLEHKIDELVPRREFEAKLVLVEAEQRKFDMRMREINLELLKLKQR